MAKVTNYQCPACTGPLHFVGASGKLECDYCGSSFEVSEIDAQYNSKVEQAKEESDKEKEKASAEKVKIEEIEGQEWNQDEIKLYNCSTCGAELICEETTVATHCPYCGNPTIIPGQFTAGVMPSKIIPFKLDKKAAEVALTNYYKGKKLLPKVFCSQNHIEEVKGVYVPFWLFDGETYADVKFHCENVHTTTDGEYEVTTTEHYSVHRAGNVPFEKVPSDASKKMDNAEMDSIEPFNYNELTDFTTSYLPGFYAEAYDETPEDVMPRIQSRIERSSIDQMRRSVGHYDRVSCSSSNVTIKKISSSYVFLPVWLLNTKWNDKNYQFAVNGQTGKIVGNLPVSAGRFCGWLFGLTAGVGAAVGIIVYLLNLYFGFFG